MRLLIQRVLSGSVTVNNEIVGKIDKGLLCLVGLTQGDNVDIVNKYADKLLKLRVFHEIMEKVEKKVPEEETISEKEPTEEVMMQEKTKAPKTWHTSVVQNNFEILVVSQFTLYGVMKGNKPDFHKALEPSVSEDLYNKFVNRLKDNYAKDKIQCGIFGEYMQVGSVNDGPVTITFDSDIK